MEGVTKQPLKSIWDLDIIVTCTFKKDFILCWTIVDSQVLCWFPVYSKVIQLYIHRHTSILFQSLVPHRLFWNIEWSSLCSTVCLFLKNVLLLYS